MAKTSAILILAAGASTRLGFPKQLFKIDGETLLHRVACRASDSRATKVLVVLGHQADAMVRELRDLQNVRTIHNPEWQNGMGTSIRAGVRELASSDAILISVCDQPHLTTAIFNELIKKLPDSPTGIVCSRYLSPDSSSDSLPTFHSPLSTPYGVPAIFASQHFPALLALPQDAGAKTLITANDVEFIDFPLGAVDIDTADDLKKL